MLKSFVLIFVTLGILFPSLSQAQEQPADTSRAARDSSESEVVKVGEQIYKLGTLTINSERREIIIPGKVNMQKGMIELLACAPGGKTHESVLVLDVIPYHFQVALLLLGLKYVGGLQYQGDPHTPRGDSVEVYVRWTKGSHDTTVRGEDLVWDIPHKKSMEHTPWVFVGSQLEEGKFLADVEKSLITTYHDPLTILDNPAQSGGDDELFRVNESLTPPKGTPVTVIIKAISLEKE
jgi:hypothetical protein